MSTVPHYRDQPATLDPNQKIPDDAPLAQGHTEEQAADVVEAADAHAEVVKAEAKAAEEAEAKATDERHKASAAEQKPQKADSKSGDSKKSG